MTPELPGIRARMDQAAAAGVFPGGVLRVDCAGETRHLSAHGRRSLRPPLGPVRADTVFDLASLTKILCTTSLCMLEVQAGRLALESPVRRYLPAFAGGPRERITVRMLLEHSSGLAAWRAFYQEIAAAGRGAMLASRRGKHAVQRMLFAEKPEAEPGTRALYSDLNFLLLQAILERLGRTPLDARFAREVTRPLGISELFFIDLVRPGARARALRRFDFAASEVCPWRLRTLLAEVHDDNAWVMGGVAGHAGLFGSAAGVAAMAQEWIAAWHGAGRLFSREVVRRFFRRSSVPGSTRALGFDTPSPADSQAGSRMSRAAVGHLGFTGNSLWLEPERGLCVVLLTNRVHPSRENESIKKFRPALHDAILEALIAWSGA